MGASRDYNKDWKNFWKEIVTTKKGKINLTQIKKELSDYSTCLEEVPKVYCEITGGGLSKPNTFASYVLSYFEEQLQEYYERGKKEANGMTNEEAFEEAKKRWKGAYATYLGGRTSGPTRYYMVGGYLDPIGRKEYIDILSDSWEGCFEQADKDYPQPSSEGCQFDGNDD